MSLLADAQRLLRRPMTSYYLLLSSAGLLLIIGLMMVLSASSIDSYVANGSAFTVFVKQLRWAVVGLIAFWFALVIPLSWYRWLSYPLLAVSIVFLIALWVRPDLGDARWINFGPLSLQPSELAKLGLALWGADILVRKQRKLTDWRQLAIPFFLVAGIILLLVGHHDLGTMLCLLLVVAGLVWVAGIRFRVLAVLVSLAFVGVIILIFSRGYRMDRLTSFIDPFADPQGIGHQEVQGLYALSTGGWWGVGLGQGRSKWEYVPEAHNDFIFAILGEELGLFGCLVVISLYAVFVYAIIRIARRVDDPFSRLVAGACGFWLAGQAYINMSAVSGLLPVTGIPLPLISAGGSSLVVTMFMVGMLASFARSEPAAAVALHARGLTWWSRLSRVPLPALSKPRPASSVTTRLRVEGRQ